MRRKPAEQKRIAETIIRETKFWRQTDKSILAATPFGNFLVFRHGSEFRLIDKGNDRVRVVRIRKRSGLNTGNVKARARNTFASNAPRYMMEAILLAIFPEEV